ncbi:MAG: hypothetical protein U9Q88_15910 [Bacillota bacterium]|nr:hypothetical protein [Bacillota bacterium]
MSEKLIQTAEKDTCETCCFDEPKVNILKNRVEEVNGVELI